MPLRIGLTGGIGSGKTTVARIFEVLGIPVYYADAEARGLMNTDSALKEKLISLFGEDAYNNNELNRSYIASLVFNNPGKLQLLNSVVHPATIRDGEQWMEQQTTPYAIKEAALIFESGVSRSLDYVIGVSAPAVLRMRRVMDRDAFTQEEVQRRMLNQMDQQSKMLLCDFIIINDEEQLLTPQVLKLHHHFLELSNKKTETLITSGT